MTATPSIPLTLLLLLAAAAPGRAQAPGPGARTRSEVRLGAQLFFDPRLSADGSLSCATCHDPATGWANPRAVDTGLQGRKGTRNAGSVLDAARMEHQFWDGRASTLEAQAWGPILNPVEMGHREAEVLATLRAIPGYRAQFKAVYGSGPTRTTVARALAAFERTVITGPSPYDRHLRGEAQALSPAARRGLELFEGRAKCFRCHRGPDLTNQGFANLGVGFGQRPVDLGREGVTGNPEDRGQFKVPSLRNVALTAPYFHDGSATTLAEVVAYYVKGGTPNPDLDGRLRVLDLTPEEQADLVAFLESLTGTLPRVPRPKLPQGPRPQ